MATGCSVVSSGRGLPTPPLNIFYIAAIFNILDSHILGAGVPLEFDSTFTAVVIGGDLRWPSSRYPCVFEAATNDASTLENSVGVDPVVNYYLVASLLVAFNLIVFACVVEKFELRSPGRP